MGVRVPVIVAVTSMRMAMIKRHYADKVHCKPYGADNQQLPYPMHLAA